MLDPTTFAVERWRGVRADGHRCWWAPNCVWQHRRNAINSIWPNTRSRARSAHWIACVHLGSNGELGSRGAGSDRAQRKFRFHVRVDASVSWPWDAPGSPASRGQRSLWPGWTHVSAGSGGAAGVEPRTARGPGRGSDYRSYREADWKLVPSVKIAGQCGWRTLRILSLLLTPPGFVRARLQPLRSPLSSRSQDDPVYRIGRSQRMSYSGAAATLTSPVGARIPQPGRAIRSGAPPSGPHAWLCEPERNMRRGRPRPAAR